MAENTNTEREAFEAQCVAMGYAREDGMLQRWTAEHGVPKSAVGNYITRAVQNMWIAWQARASLPLPAAGQEPDDPMDWKLPCDVTVGHGTMCKGVSLRTLVTRMKVLYEMATGNNADEVANRTPEQRTALADAFRARLAAAPQPAVAAGWMDERENLRKALQFYADGEHFIKSDDSAWDTVSGEPQNYWCDETGTATVEDGSIARLALEGRPIRFEEDDSALPPAPSTEGESNG